MNILELSEQEIFRRESLNQLRELGCTEAQVNQYEKGNPSFMSVSGLLRYWKLKSEGRI